MSLAEQVTNYVKSAYVESARTRGEKQISIRAGDVHKDLHLVNRVPSVCSTLASLKFQSEAGLHLVGKQGPPSGNSTTVVFTYRIASREGGETGSRHVSLESLYGISKDTFRRLGGGERYLRGEREGFVFSSERRIRHSDEDQ